MRTFVNKYHAHYAALAHLGVPIIIGQVGTIVLGFADTLMIGHHSTLELAAASFVNTMFVLALIFSLGFSYGLTPVVSGLYGRGEHERVGETVRNGLAANMLMALLLVAVMTVLYLNIHRLGQPEALLPLMRPYFIVNLISLPFVMVFNTMKQFADGTTDTRTPMWILIGGNILNILGNWVLIYGKFGLPELGLFGAGISTMLSRVVMALAFMYVFMRRKGYMRFRAGFVQGCVNRTDFIRLNSMGWPLALQMGMETAAFSLSGVMVGWIGIEALAAHQIMLTVSQLFYMVYYGMAAAVAIRVSYFNGQRDLEALRDTTVAGMHLILAIAVCVSVPIFALRDMIGGWFNDSAGVCLLISQVTVPLIVYQFGDCLQCTFANALRGLSYVRPMMFIAFFAYFVMCLPLGYLFGFTMNGGLVGIWYSYTFGLTAAGVLYYVFFRKRLRENGAQMRNIQG